MNNEYIVQYTTPTITITFPTVDVTTIHEAYLVFKYADTNILVKELADAVVGDGTLSWTLTQVDTGKLPLNATVRVYCDWVLVDTTRGRSRYADYAIVETGISEVI